jgi:hypothetical protein
MFKNLFNKNENLLPWQSNESIYQFLKKQLDEHGKIDNENLPDEEELFKDKRIRFASGALDNIFGGGGSDSDFNQNKVVHDLIKLIRRQIKYQHNKTRRATYLKVMDDHTLQYIDPFLDSLHVQVGIDLAKLQEEAEWFIKNSAHRGAIKFGIALLGILNCEADKELLLTIGRHEEFTLYAAVALMNGTENPNDNLFALAKSVHGWGKINVVERLEPSTPEIKYWLLTEGCENRIMNEYLAYTCAVKGGLHNVLQENEIDYPIYRGACTIIDALIYGGPAEDIDDYEHSSSVVSRYLYHSDVHAQSLQDFLTIILIHEFLKDVEEQWNERYKKSWNPQLRSELLNKTEKFLTDESWKDMALAELAASIDNLYVPLKVARAFHVDVWPILFKKLHENPLQETLYYELMRTSDSRRIEQLVSFAERHLPLGKIGSGPALELGLGKDYKLHSCLDFIIQDLDQFDGVGISLIEAALQSPVVRNRNMAINALEQWQVDSWSNSQCAEVLRKLAEIEPDEEVRERVKELVRKI